MNGILDAQPELRQQLLDWENQASGDVRVHLQRLREDSVAARTEAAKVLATLGTASRGAMLGLMECWGWAPPRPKGLGRLELTRRADAIRAMRRAVDEALAAIGAPVVEPLVTLVQSDDDRLDPKAGILAEIRDPAAVEPLVVALGADLLEIREAAARALGAIGDARAVEALGRALADPEKAVRQQAAVMLRQIGGGEAIQCLIDGLRSGDANVREAASELANVTDPEVADLLLTALNDDNEQVVVHAARALGAQKDLGARLPLLGLVAGPSQPVQTAAIEALDRIEPDWRTSRLGYSIVPTLLENLKGQDPGLRARAAELLGGIGDSRALTPLIEALADDSATRGAAAAALGRMGDTHAVEPLIRALEAETDGVARRRMIHALGRLGDARATDALIAQLSDKRALDCVAAAVGALGEIGDPRAVEPLLTVVTDEGYSFPTAKAAAETLGVIGDPRAIDGLRAAMGSHWTDNTRVAGFIARAAGEAIQRIERASLQRPGGAVPA